MTVVIKTAILSQRMLFWKRRSDPEGDVRLLMARIRFTQSGLAQFEEFLPGLSPDEANSWVFPELMGFIHSEESIHGKFKPDVICINFLSGSYVHPHNQKAELHSIVSTSSSYVNARRSVKAQGEKKVLSSSYFLNTR